MIEINGLVKKYRIACMDNEVVAINDISYRFNQNGFYFILGKSGCGKTTLINVLCGLDNYDLGNILIHGENIKNFSEKKLDEYRNIKIGIIFQQYNLLPDMNVYENLRLVLELQEWDCSEENRKEYIDKRIADILNVVGLSGYEKRRISQLSGGEQQRIAIARSLLKNPDVIFADEPTGNLDENTGVEILRLLKSLSREYLIIMVSHDKENAYNYGDYIINMSDGKIKRVDELEKGSYSYSFSIKKSDSKVVSYRDLNSKALICEMEKIFTDSENGDTLEIININKKIIHHSPEVIHYGHERKNVRTRKLSNIYKLRLAGIYLKKRKRRLFFTTLVTALSLILLFFSLYINFYNKDEIILEYMKKNSPSILPVYFSTQYTDDFYIEQSKDLKKGNYLSEIVEENMSHITNVAQSVSEETINYDIKLFSNATFIFCEDFTCLDLDLEGNYPETLNEVIITDYIAKRMNKKVGDIIQYQNVDLKITGVIQTDYIEYQLDRKLIYGSDDNFFQFNCEYVYFVIYAKNELLSYCQNNKTFLNIPYSDFLYEKKDSLYFNSFLDVGNVKEISENEIVEGRFPESENEIVVSLAYLQKHSMEIEEVYDDKYFFKDIHDASYNEYYTDCQNMNSYYKEGVKIVGIVENKMGDVAKDIYVHQSVWDKIIRDYYKYYYTRPILFPQQEEYEDIVDMASSMEIFFDEPATNNIVMFDKTIKKIEMILAIILTIVMTINFVLIATFVGISIGENKKSIGVLRSLGVRISECMQIFSIEFYTIYLASFSSAAIAISFLIKIVNDFFANDLNEVKYDIIRFDVTIFIVVAVVEWLIGYAAIKYPIRKIKKEKPIETIKDNN